MWVLSLHSFSQVGRTCFVHCMENNQVTKVCIYLEDIVRRQFVQARVGGGGIIGLGRGGGGGGGPVCYE